MGDATKETATAAPESGRRKQGLRRWSAGVAVLAVIATLAVAIALLEWLEWPFLHRPVESALRHALKREVSVGPDFGIRFIGSLRLRTDLLVVGPAPNGPNLSDADGRPRDLLRASRLALTIPYATLFSLARRQPADDGADDASTPRRRPYIARLEVERLDAALARSADGRANWRFGDETDVKPVVLPEFGRLAMRGGEILFEDAVQPARIAAEIRTLEGTAAETSGEAAAGLEITARGQYREHQLTALLRSSGLLPLADSDARTPPVPFRLKLRIGPAELDFDGTGSDLQNLGGLDGRFRIAGPSLAAVGDAVGVTLPTTAAFVMNGHAAREGAVWSAQIEELSIGTSRLNGSFRYDPTRRVPKLSGKLGGPRLSLPDLGPAFGAPPRPRSATALTAADARPARTGKSAGTAGRVLPQREFDLPSLAAMDADVGVGLDAFDLGTAQLEALTQFRAHIALEDQVLTVSDIEARSADGKVAGTISLNARPRIPLWRANLNWSGVQLERFIKPRNPTDRAKAEGYVNGSLHGRARLAGSGRSTASMLASLDGEAQLWVRNGNISHLLVEVIGLDIAQALGMLVRGDAKLPMRCAVAGFNIKAGKVWPEAAVIETSDSTLSLDGVVSLADERLGLVFRTRPKDISPMTLRSPLYIEGTFAAPEIRLDKASIGGRLVAAAALAAITPVAGLLALIDLGEPEKKVCEDAVQRMRAASPGFRRAP